MPTMTNHTRTIDGDGRPAERDRASDAGRHDARQLLPSAFGQTGQRRLRRARVLLVGRRALGSAVADPLVRAGIGHLVIANRLLLRFRDAATGHELTVLPDGRAIVKGTTDPTATHALSARFVGHYRRIAMIDLDNAATTWPKPPAVSATLGGFLQRVGANRGRSGHRMAVGAAAALADTRLRLARLMHAASPERIVFADIATDALNRAVRGPLRPGDRASATSFDLACRTGLRRGPDACRTSGAFPGGASRFSPGFFSTDDEIDTAITAVHELAAAPAA